MKLIKLIIAVFFLLVSSSAVHAQSPKTLEFAISETSTDVVNAYHQFLQQVYADLGYELTMKKVPLKRVYAYADSGKVDGILLASKEILKYFKNIVEVPVPLTQIELMVYTVKESFEVNGPDSIKPYKVGILRGYPLSEKITANLKPHTLNNYNSLFSVLRVGRVDIVLAMHRETERFIRDNPGFEDIKALAPPLVVLPLYHFLNQKHADLVAQVAPIMKQKIEEGLLEKLYEPYK